MNILVYLLLNFGTSLQGLRGRSGAVLHSFSSLTRGRVGVAWAGPGPGPGPGQKLEGTRPTHESIRKRTDDDRKEGV